MDRRQRTGYLVLAVVLSHVILISAQVNAQPGGTVLEAVTFGVFTEVQRLFTSTRDGFVGFWSGYAGLRDVRQENEALNQEVARLSLELQQQRALAQQTRSLERLLELRESVRFPTLSARVIATDATPYFRTLTIDRGRRDGVHEDMAVVTPDGVVGRVVGVPGPRAAQVQLLIDRNAAAGALIERSRASGVAVGTDGDGQLRMEHVSNLQDVRVGDRIVTSGIDGIYPEGFLIGRVTDATEGLGLYRIIDVHPVVDFSQIEDVLVVMDARSAPSDVAGE
jgi:rod shape-determining protein MreC